MEVLTAVLRTDVDEFRERRRNSPLRAVAARYLMRYGGLSQRDVATHLDAGSGAAISKQMFRYRELLSTDKKLVWLLKKVERLLNERREQNCER